MKIFSFQQVNNEDEKKRRDDTRIVGGCDSGHIPWYVLLKITSECQHEEHRQGIDYRDARPAPGKMAALARPSPKNFQDCPARPRKCSEFSCYPALPPGLIGPKYAGSNRVNS